MNKNFLLPIAAGIGGLAAFGLRLAQNLTGFEDAAGLPIPGSLPGLALLFLLAGLAVILMLLCRRLDEDRSNPPVFPRNFQTADAGLLMLPVAGVFLMAISGTADLLMGAGILNSTAFELPGIGVVHLFVSSSFSTTAHLILGVLSLASAIILFPAVVACRRREDAQSTASHTGLLLPAVMLIVRLVFTYRVVSVNPSLEEYYVELLALVFLTLGFYRLSAFAFHAGRVRVFSAYCGGAVVLSLTALADAGRHIEFPSLLLYLGSAAVLLGFLILLLAAPAVEEDSAEEI